MVVVNSSISKCNGALLGQAICYPAAKPHPSCSRHLGIFFAALYYNPDPLIPKARLHT